MEVIPINISESIDLYTRASIDLISALELERSRSLSIFTEGSDDIIIQKITESIRNAFNKFTSAIRNGKIKLKADKQSKAIKQLGKSVKGISDVKIKIQNVWDFYLSVNKTINNYVKHPTEKGLIVMNKATGKSNKAIIELTNGLNKVASAMRSPSSKEFEISDADMKKVLTYLMSSAAMVHLANNAIKGANRVYDKKVDKSGEELKKEYRRKMPTPHFNPDGTSRDDPESVTLALFSPGKRDRDYQLEKVYTKLKPIELAKIDDIVSKNKKAGKKQIDQIRLIANIIYSVEIAVGAFMVATPKKSGTEEISIGYLYKRLVNLKADKLPSEIASIGDNDSSFLSNTKVLQSLISKTGSSSESLKISQNITSLLSAYANFHQTLIDFYISIIADVVKQGGKVMSTSIHEPHKIINTSKL